MPTVCWCMCPWVCVALRVWHRRKKISTIFFLGFLILYSKILNSFIEPKKFHPPLPMGSVSQRQRDLSVPGKRNVTSWFPLAFPGDNCLCFPLFPQLLRGPLPHSLIHPGGSQIAEQVQKQENWFPEHTVNTETCFLCTHQIVQTQFQYIWCRSGYQEDWKVFVSQFHMKFCA